MTLEFPGVITPRRVFDTAIGRAPFEPAKTDAFLVVLPTSGARFPAECPCCASASNTPVEVMLEKNPFRKFGGTVGVEVPFCGDCAAKVRKRERFTWVWLGVMVLALSVAFNLTSSWRADLNYEPVTSQEAQDAVDSKLRLIKGLGFVFLGLLMGVIFRAIHLFIGRRWYLGIRPVELAPDFEQILMRCDRRVYGEKLAALNGRLSVPVK